MKKLILLITLIYTGLVSQAWNIFNTSNSGIPSNNIRAIEFDQQGNAWIATDSGLVKHNGTNWQVFRTSNSGIISNDVRCVKVDIDNVKWIGTSSGLSKFNDTSWVTYTISNSGLSDNYIRAIQIDKLNKKYLILGSDLSETTNSTGYTVFNDTTWTQYTTLNSSLFSNSIREILIDSLNKKWILYANITKYSVIDTANNWNTFDSPSPIGLYSICEGLNNTKWFGLVGGNGIAYLADSGWGYVPFPNEITDLGSIITFRITFTNRGSKIWCSSVINRNNIYFYFVSIYDTQTQDWTILSQSNYPIRIGYSIKEDVNQNIWMRSVNGLIKIKCISPISNLSTDSTYICKKDSIKLTYKGNKNPSLWILENGLSCKNASNYFYAKDTGIYHLYFTDNNGCSILGSSKYNVGNSFNAQVTSNQDTACLKSNSFTLISKMSEDTAESSTKWNLVKSNSSLANPTISFDTAGTYNISLIATSAGGCIDTATKILTVLPNPTAGPMLGTTTSLIVATPYVYTVAQQPNHTYNWVVTNGIIAAGQGTNAATVQWLSNGKGNLKAEVTNTQGCIDTTATQVTIGNVGLNETTSFNNLLVYPNPNNGSFSLSFTASQSELAEFSLVNLLGQKIWSENKLINQGENEIKIITTLSPGIYYLRMTGESGEIINKILIQ